MGGGSIKCGGRLEKTRNYQSGMVGRGGGDNLVFNSMCTFIESTH